MKRFIIPLLVCMLFFTFSFISVYAQSAAIQENMKVYESLSNDISFHTIESIEDAFEEAILLEMINNLTNYSDMANILLEHNDILQLDFDGDYASLTEKQKIEVYKSLVSMQFSSIQQIQYEFMRIVEKEKSSPKGGGGGSKGSGSSASPILPQFFCNQSFYKAGDTVELSLVFTDTSPEDKTNSVTFHIVYDQSAFELQTGDLDLDVVEGYLDLTEKYSSSSEGEHSIILLHLNTEEDTQLQEGKKLFTIHFKVKEAAESGEKTFELKPIEMLDSEYNVYNINDGEPVFATVNISNYAEIAGYVSLYLGTEDTGFNEYILENLDQEAINKIFSTLTFNIKHDSSHEGVIYKGSEVFIADQQGNLASRVGNKIIGQFRLQTNDFENTILTIGEGGYLAKEFNISIVPGYPTYIGSEVNPVVLYPGDLAHVNNGLVLEPDGKISNADFSGWLKIYRDHLSGIASPEEFVKADFTRNGTIDNVDFSLWLSSYKKLLGSPGEAPTEPTIELRGTIVASRQARVLGASYTGKNKVAIRVKNPDGSEEELIYDVGDTLADQWVGRNQFVNEQTIFFVINDFDKAYFVVDIDSLEDGEIYDAAVYMLDDDWNASVVVLYNWYRDISDHKIALIDRLSVVQDENGDTVYKLYLVYDGEAEYTICTSAEMDYVNLNPGDIIQFDTDKSGKINLLEVLFNIRRHDIDYWEEYGRMRIVFTQVEGIGAPGRMAITAGEGVYNLNHANIYQFDTKLDRASVVSKDYLAPGDYVFVRLYDDLVEEVVRYANYEDYGW